MQLTKQNIYANIYSTPLTITKYALKYHEKNVKTISTSILSIYSHVGGAFFCVCLFPVLWNFYFQKYNLPLKVILSSTGGFKTYLYHFANKISQLTSKVKFILSVILKSLNMKGHSSSTLKYQQLKLLQTQFLLASVEVRSTM